MIVIKHSVPIQLSTRLIKGSELNLKVLGSKMTARSSGYADVRLGADILFTIQYVLHTTSDSFHESLNPNNSWAIVSASLVQEFAERFRHFACL